VAAAWIGFAGGLIAAMISAVVAVRQSRMDQRLTQLNHDLDVEVHRREAIIDRDIAAEAVLARYREPLAAAAFDLQSRLYNILKMDFFGLYGEGHPRAEDALRTTVFRMAQYFGWTEILRREIQFLNFPEDDATREVARLQAEISNRFLTHQGGTELMIWADEQRGIGERMVVEDNGSLRCMGYAAFRDHCEVIFAPWWDRLQAELKEEPSKARMLEVQHLLCDLVAKLDDRHVRYDPKYLQPA
jgi:hypothetical protein